jgi:hypothetical protein
MRSTRDTDGAGTGACPVESLDSCVSSSLRDNDAAATLAEQENATDADRDDRERPSRADSGIAAVNRGKSEKSCGRRLRGVQGRCEQDVTIVGAES